MYRIIKRLFDILSASLLFLVISPIFLILALLVRINLGSPIFFKQQRATKEGKPFYILKFRTMTEKKDEKGVLLPDEQRQTKFGILLRSSSLDELPELLNIIKGDMSVIGPRPLPVIYNDYYRENETARLNVRAGLIPPEVMHNNVYSTWEEQLTHEAEYAENLSFGLDVKVFFSVFKVLFKRLTNNYGEYVRQPLHIERKHEKTTYEEASIK